MGQTPTFNDQFARRGAPAKPAGGAGQDRFAEQAGRGGSGRGPVDRFSKPAGPKGDAFAASKSGAGPVDRFGGKPAQARTTGFGPSPAPIVSQAPPPVAAPAPKRTPLHVVAKQPIVEVAAEEPIEVKYQDLKREEAVRRRAGKSSSLVLVTGSATAADVLDAPAPAPARTETAPPVAPPPPAAPEPRTGGGGGGGGGSGTRQPPREHRFNQDDFVGVMFGVAVLFLLLLWLMRWGQPAQEGEQLVGVQSAANLPISVPPSPPPPQKLDDPFGNRAVDLTPKGPIPEAPKEQAAVAPAPAVPVVAPDRAMHAWFCTAGSKLTVASRKALEHELTQFSDAFKGKELVVRGYADTRGSTDFNAALGGARASVVADFLRTKGLTIVDDEGVGELSGLDDNQNCANQRRVDVFVKGGPGEEPTRACAPEPEVEPLVCG